MCSTALPAVVFITALTGPPVEHYLTVGRGKKKRPQCGCEACGTVSEGSAPLQSASYSGTVVLELLLGTWYALPVSRACLACVHGPELALLANDLSAAIEGAAEIFYKSRYM